MVSTLSLPEFIRAAPCLLGEGAIIERLRRNPATPLDGALLNSAFVYDPLRRAALADLYRGYIEIGRTHRLPMLLTASTWRAQIQNIAAAGWSHRPVNADNVRLLQDLRAETGDYASSLLIGGLIGPRGDAYRPEQSLSETDARRFHAWQSEQLADAGVDFLFGITLPALSEALGLAAALAVTGRPYMLGFVLRPNGTLLDGTPLAEAISRIDERVQPAPTAYLVNCTHPGFVHSALQDETHCPSWVRSRLLGVLGNTAALSPEALDGLEHLVEEEPARFAQAMINLRRDFGLRLLGGCCGTDDRHIHALADRMSSVVAGTRG
jgi:homocysteine S-methyltransferase